MMDRIKTALAWIAAAIVFAVVAAWRIWSSPKPGVDQDARDAADAARKDKADELEAMDDGDVVATHGGADTVAGATDMGATAGGNTFADRYRSALSRLSGTAIRPGRVGRGGSGDNGSGEDGCGERDG